MTDSYCRTSNLILGAIAIVNHADTGQLDQ